MALEIRFTPVLTGKVGEEFNKKADERMKKARSKPMAKVKSVKRILKKDIDMF